ncbi:CRTAC1 family protein, partial [bacterium]|nr:CRTAC1 family protein [bacterium]
DVTQKAGLNDFDFGSSATWFDYDKDGKLDLFVCNYVKWSIDNDLFCTLDGVNKSYCTPESYQGESSRLYRNRGNKTFENVTRKAGLLDPTSKALGVIAFDYNRDGWQDLFVANDTQPNKLYHNNGNGTFSEKGVLAGVAFSEAGVARAGMGVDATDYDGSGYPSLLIGNFSNEMLGLYHNEGTGLFIDEAPASTVGQNSLLTLTFGAFFFDFDLDGKEDIFAANGHVHDDIERVQQQVKYAEPPHLFRNLGNKQFEVATQKVGPDLSKPVVARGAAYGDIDSDGDLDILISTNGGLARLLRNDSGSNHYLRFKTTGSQSNKDGIGARITLHFEDGKTSWKTVKAGSSYCSQSELPVTFGLGNQTKVKLVEVAWPSGKTTRLENVPADQTIQLNE